jgi:hypothetical protein
MKIIDLGVCIDNNDPKGLGRIRCIDYDDYVAGKENYKKYTPYDENDPFIALPFLPNNINFIPEVNQTVKVLRYNTEKTTVNQEYIAGPFTTRYDYSSQTFSQQIASTTFGIGVKKKKDIFKNGALPPDCANTLAKNTDYAISGKYGSDVLMTEGGLVLRGGKLLSKQSASTSERERLADFPLASKKVAKLQLKKFPEKKVNKIDIVKKTTYENADLKYIIEYSVDDLNSPQIVDFFVYKIQGQTYGDLFKTNTFTEFTDTSSLPVVLLNADDTTTTPTLTVDMSTMVGFDFLLNVDGKISLICSEIRTKLLKIKEDGFVGLFSADVNKKFSNPEELTLIYPFFFRPTQSFRTYQTSNTTELERKNTVLSNIRLAKGVVQSGLVWSATQFKAPSVVNFTPNSILIKDSSSREQTFGSVVADKLYLLSTDTNFTGKSIDFEKLDGYEYTQDNYLNLIDPNTYGVVRGEILLEFLRSMFNVMLTHTHNINKPYARTDYEAHNTMVELYNKLESELLNKSVRIN